MIWLAQLLQDAAMIVAIWRAVRRARATCQGVEVLSAPGELTIKVQREVAFSKPSNPSDTRRVA